MIKIDGNTLKVTRGDRVGFDFKIKDYTFKIGDKITFKVYEKKGFDKLYVLKNDTTMTEAKSVANITLSSNETKIGEIENKPVTYWYELILNNETTIIGYEDDPAEFILLPEGRDV